MAATVVPIVSVTKWNTAVANVTALAIDATDGATLTPTAADERLMIMMINSDASNATTCTIKKPTSGYGIGAVADLAITLAAGVTKVICIETNRFKAAYGDDKGKIKFVDTAADTKLIAYQLPQ